MQEIKPGKWMTRGGDVVNVRRNQAAFIGEIFWAVERGNCTYYVDTCGRRPNVHGASDDLDKPVVDQIIPGTNWKTKDFPDRSVYVVGKSACGEMWVIEVAGEVRYLLEADFIEPWIDAPKPRTWTHFLYVSHGPAGEYIAARDTREQAEKVAERISSIVEVTLTEAVE